MSNSQSDPPPTPVPAPPLETAPSATGMIDGDEDEIEPAPPAKDLGE